MTFSAPISLTELRTAFDAQTATITANKRLGQKDSDVNLTLMTLAQGAHLLTRSIAWTQTDDQELRAMYLRVIDGTAGRIIVATLSVDDGETQFLGADQTFTATLTTVNGTADARVDFRTTTGKRARLLNGVRYRLDIENTTAETTVSGALNAGVQTRSVRRGGGGGPAHVPHGFRAGNLDVEKINDNLMAIADDVQDLVNMRYTYSRAFVSLAGIVDTDTAALRQFPIRRPGSSNAVELIAVELVGTNVDTDATWTLSKLGDSLWPTISITGGGASIEEYNSTGISAQVASSAADTILQISANTATGKAINAGYLVIHTRTSRNNQGSTNVGYTPTLFNSVSSTAAATLQAQIDAIAAAVTADTAAQKDLRCDVYVARALTAGSSVTFRRQAGAGADDFLVQMWAVAANTVTARVTADGQVLDVVGGGVAVTAFGSAAITGSGNTDPMLASNDTGITIKNQAGAANVLLAIAIVWWR